ncbi:MAG: tetratricopeptide repeat protein [Rhodospirillales bacterium]
MSGKLAAPAGLLTQAVRLHQAGRLDEAASAYARVLAAQPRQPDGLHLSGLVRHQQGDQQAARRFVEAAIAAAPKVVAYRISLVAILLAQRHTAEALVAAERAVTMAPELAAARLALGNARLAGGDEQGAIAAYEAALAADPDSAEALNNLGSTLQRAGRLDAAEAALRQAIGLRPGHPGQLANLGLVLRDQGRFDEAAACYDRALAADPQHATTRANRATLLLQQGRFAEGWAEYEWRWRAPGFTSSPRRFASPAWNGADPAGRTLLLHAEQGLGSAIQFVRYAPLVAGRGARVIVECPPPLVRLFRASLVEAGGAVAGGVARVIPRGEPLPPFDAQAPLMSLPHLCRTTLATVPASIPYLRADPTAAAYWRQRLTAAAGSAALRVGLAWAGNPAHANDHNRSLPAAAAALLAPLLALPGVRFVSLQVGDAAAMATATDLAALGLIERTDELHDFADTAALVSALDLVIAVDTAVAHLAGALGRPVWLLTPPIPEWRWLLDRDDSPWYPSMRLFRQSTAGDWAGVIARVGSSLRRWLAAGDESAAVP